MGDATAQKYDFNGREYEETNAFNIMEMDFRQYDPSLGRFQSIDALAEAEMGLTPYHFAGGNPVMFGDPTGLVRQIIKAGQINEYWVTHHATLSYDAYSQLDWRENHWTKGMNFGPGSEGYLGGYNGGGISGGGFGGGFDAESASILRSVLEGSIYRLKQKGDKFFLQYINWLPAATGVKYESYVGYMEGAFKELVGKFAYIEVQDLSEKFDKQLRETQEFFSRSRRFYDGISGMPGRTAMKLENFRRLVTDGGKFDLKAHGYSQENVGIVSFWHGRVMRVDDYGNFNYGVAANHYGYELWFAQMGAGMNQLGKFDGFWNPSGWGDDPRDQQMVSEGYNYMVGSPFLAN